MDKKTQNKRQLRVLCLEDEPKDAELTESILEDAGYNLLINRYDNEKEFLAAIRCNEYDIILADYKLPGFDAPSALRLAKKICPEIPFICVSGTMGEDVAVDLLKQGATDYVLKDRMQRLPSAVQRALDESAEQKARKQAEEALTDSEKKFRSLVENAFDAIYLMRGTHLEYVNPRFSELTGYSVEELTSKNFNFEQLLCENNDNIIDKLNFDRQKDKDTPHQYEIQLKTKKQGILNVELSIVSLGSREDVVILGMIHDLTRRKQAEAALLKAHKLLKETQAISKLGGWDYDVATKNTVWTDEVYRIYGLEKDYDPNTNSIGLTFYTPENAPIIEKAFKNAVEKGIPYDLELELIKADEKRIWVRTIGKPHFQDDKVVRVSGNIIDITARKKAEEELMALSSRQEAILSAVPDILMEIDKHNIYTWANQAGMEFFGENVIGKNVDFFFEETQEPSEMLQPHIERSDVSYIESWQRRMDGEKRLLAWWSRELKNKKGETTGILSSARDITEGKKIQETNKHLNRVLRSIRDINQLIVTEKDPQIIINKTSDILVKHRGYGEVMIILADEEGKPLKWAQTGMGEKFKRFENDLKKGKLSPCCDKTLLDKGITILSVSNNEKVSKPLVENFTQDHALVSRISHNNKTYGYISVAIGKDQIIDDEEKSLFLELAGDVAFALYNIEQMNAKKQAEDDRDRIEAELRQSQKMEAVGQLAGGIAHDFNNMLTVILGYTDLALAKLNSDDPLHRNFLEIQAASLRSMNIIRQLLAFSRKQLIAPQAAKLNDYISEMLRMIGRLIGEDIKLQFIPGKDLWNIWIDPSQISQILTNLAINARDAISDVGTVKIETTNIVIDEAFKKVFNYVIPGEYVCLTFTDTGTGIDPEIINRIFEPFFTTKEEGKGTGLGLSTVYGIVKQNNGYIHVYSEPGIGTNFKIYFPRYCGEVEKHYNIADNGIITGTETILIVEDYEEILYLAVEILEKYGYQVLKARNPDDAVMTSEQYKDEIQLLITDVVMPTMNGKALEEKIKIKRPQIKTLFMSGYTADIIAKRGVIKPGVAFLQKPFSVESLITKVRDVLDS